MSKQDRSEYWYLFIGLFVFILICIVSASCTTQLKVEKWNRAHPVEAAEYCAETFPVVDQTEVRVDTLSDTVTVVRSISVFDTLYMEGKPVLVHTKCPPSQVITRTIRKDSLIRRENTARVEALTGQLQVVGGLLADRDRVIADKDKRIAELEAQITAKNKRLFWLYLLIGGLLVALFRKPLITLAFKLISPIRGIPPPVG